MVLRNLVRVQRLELGLVSDAIGEFTDTGQDAGTVGLGDASLIAHAELDCEPVDGSEALELDLAGPERCKADLLTEVRELLMCEHGSMAHQFVDNIGLRRVKRLSVVTNVLGRVEYPEGQAIEELALREQSANRLQAPPSSLLEELGDVL